MNKALLQQLAPTGELRVGINMANFLLVSGTSEDGEPYGVSPTMAAAMAKQLEVPVRLVRYKGPGDVADAAGEDVSVKNTWDIANIAAEPARAKVIVFSPAYCEIQATYLLPANSPLLSVADVDSPGNRIAVKDRAAYELWLTDNLKHATLVKEESHDAAFDVFDRDSLEALAGLRPALLKQQETLAGSTILDASFTAVQQAIGCRHGMPEAAAFIESFVQESISSGFVESLIDKYNVTGKLSVAPLA